jgi:hypothetical protein
MGGAIGSIGKAIGGVVKQVAPSIIKAVAPAATSLLSKITDGFVNKGADFLKGALSKLPLPSPLKSLADKLIGKGADMLKNLGGGLIEKGIQKLTELVTSRLAPGAGQVALPGTSTAERQAGITNPANNPATGSQTNAASGTGGSGGISNPSAPSGASGTPDTMPKFEGDPASIKDQNAHNEKMFKYQQAMSMMQQFWSQMSNIQKGNDDVKKQIAGNFR